MLGFPARGNEPLYQSFDYALFTQGSWVEERLPALADDFVASVALPPEYAHLRAHLAHLVETDRDDVSIRVVKPAWRGDGIIVRLQAFAPPRTVAVWARGRTLRQAFLCDARERDLSPLPIVGGRTQVDVHHALSTVRLVCD